MVHVPFLTSLIVAPFVPLEVHTVGLAEVNVTVRPADDVALTVNGDCPSSLFASEANVMV